MNGLWQDITMSYVYYDNNTFELLLVRAHSYSVFNNSRKGKNYANVIFDSHHDSSSACFVSSGCLPRLALVVQHLCY